MEVFHVTMSLAAPIVARKIATSSRMAPSGCGRALWRAPDANPASTPAAMRIQ